jgi:hypothetical protein
MSLLKTPTINTGREAVDTEVNMSLDSDDDSKGPLSPNCDILNFEADTPGMRSPTRTIYPNDDTGGNLGV